MPWDTRKIPEDPHWPRVLRKATGSTDKLELPRATRQDVWWLELRVSSLVRFYKSRFWFFSENFLKKFWINFLKKFWKICESRDFLLPAIQKWMKTCCFAAVFKLFCCYFQTFCVAFLKFWRISDFFQKFFRTLKSLEVWLFMWGIPRG